MAAGAGLDTHVLYTSEKRLLIIRKNLIRSRERLNMVTGTSRSAQSLTLPKAKVIEKGSRKFFEELIEMGPPF